jgi:hypothetical protein
MGWVVNATPRQLYPQEWPGTQCIGGWVGPWAGLDGCGKSRPPPGFEPRTVQLVARRYTYWATRPINTVSYTSLIYGLVKMCGNMPKSLVRKTTVTNQKNLMGSVKELAAKNHKKLVF